jgi:hypothetical protein
MRSQFRSIALTAFIAALASIETSVAEAKQQCSAAVPSSSHGRWWSYRLIDGRKCWYEGKPGLSKSLLEWPSETSVQTGPDDELASTVREKASYPPASQVRTPDSTPKDPDTTFQARWTDIAPLAPSQDTGSSESEVNERPPLTKGDRLPLPLPR